MWTWVVALLTGLVLQQQVHGQCDEVCYPDLECFDNCAPFTEFPLPKSPEYIDTEFHLFTRENRDTAELINVGNLGTFFDGNKPGTKFVLHGFAGSALDGWMNNMKDDLLDRGDYNYIIVDWAPGALPDFDEPTVLYPASNTRVVARQIRNLVREMRDERDMLVSDVHCIGFSAGGQACGFLGKEFISLKIGRISGLDPAGDIFDMNDTRGRLSEEDASFVDVIHTNARGIIATSGIGRAVGQVDFWPNQGERQPGCVELGILLEDTCSHLRVTSLFVESISSQCLFTAHPCDSLEDIREGRCSACSGNTCERMGYHADRNIVGNYVLTTNSTSPFCID